MMDVIDADTHVVECEKTWDYLEPDELRFRPRSVTASSGPARSRNFWLIEGAAYPRPGGDASLERGVWEMSDVNARLRATDKMGVDIQVLFPSAFLRALASTGEAQIALSKSYNRWLADACGQASKRLRWAVLPPPASMSETVAELEYGKRHGAAAVFLRGVEGERSLADPHFDPLYEKASALGLPICVHVGIGNPADAPRLFNDIFRFAIAPVISAFVSLVTGGIPERFPELRFAFLEAGAQWLPFVIQEAMRRLDQGSVDRPTSSLLRDQRLYVACQTTDDLAYILRWSGGDNLIIGTDFGHDDPYAEMDAITRLRDNGDLGSATVDNILEANPGRLFGL